MLMNHPAPPAWHIERACMTLEQGQLLAYPTEAVWGLGCDPHNDAALQALLWLKQRPWHKGLIVVTAHLADVLPWLLPLSEQQQHVICAPQPHPTTWLLPCKPNVSPLLVGHHSSLAVRISTHPVVKALCEQFGPVVSTSANRSGHPANTSFVQVQRHFSHDVGYVLPGALGGHHAPSQIRTLSGQRVR